MNNDCAHYLWVCRVKDDVINLRSEKTKDEELRSKCLMLLEKCESEGKDIIESLEKATDLKKDILAILDRQQSAKPLQKSIDKYKNYCTAVEEIWQYFEMDYKKISPDSIHILLLLQKSFNQTLQNLIDALETKSK